MILLHNTMILLLKKRSEHKNFTTEFYWNVKKDTMTLFITLFHEFEIERELLNSFLEAIINFTTRQDNDLTTTTKTLHEKMT